MKKIYILTLSMSIGLIIHSQQELIVNGSFEQGNQGWDFTWSEYAYTGGICSAQQGNKYLWFGATDEQNGYISSEDEVSQTFVMPNNLSHADFTFSVSGASNEQDEINEYDKLFIRIIDPNENVVFEDSLSNANLDSTQTIPYCEVWDTYPNVTISNQYAGQTLIVLISSINDGTYPTLFRLDNFSLKAYTTSGISEQLIDLITVEPNPTKGVLNIKNNNKENINITLHNSLGQNIKDFSLENGDNKIDVSNYSSGIYFVKNTAGSTLKVVIE